ncbi:3-oxo-5-alpha-steroid 4-dehydrogenase-domain-containing protein [Cercophora scortea]|uniref:3-oxo-5-alpha-steroid 4-dehydrogenase-domain-containing protein n=1 Tax=Cercophora scortea TaxID=314031 RepID=A0AAE0M623_9PEZI|nr:3-oxo-5-alpha-steroid 4-dehydrogenase-domain-containing protein [Cercophora scortea]
MTTATTGLIPNWYPPNRENYELILTLWTWFPVFASLQWLVSWYGMGKTSTTSRLNFPGRIGWLTMECPGFLSLLYTLNKLSAPGSSLPWQNQVLAALFVIHYIYRAVLFPFIQPSMSPIHALVWVSALTFQVVNGTCIGAWLAAYGPTTQAAWEAQLGKYSTLQFVAGIAIFYLGLAANYYHDDELREIRRREMERLQRLTEKDGAAKKNGVEKHYEIPQAGLFKVMLYPHYFVEWVEWFGFYMAAGWGCVPARCFLVNEVTSMLPRAVKGRQWYAEKFGEDKIRGRWAVIPGVW